MQYGARFLRKRQRLGRRNTVPAPTRGMRFGLRSVESDYRGTHAEGALMSRRPGSVERIHARLMYLAQESELRGLKRGANQKIKINIKRRHHTSGRRQVCEKRWNKAAAKYCGLGRGNASLHFIAFVGRCIHGYLKEYCPGSNHSRSLMTVCVWYSGDGTSNVDSSHRPLEYDLGLGLFEAGAEPFGPA
ncbi:hypothetical protein B0H19DRAFT_1081662 [Mycena capillaripes]|nr:hypothetical protein B0H19DRAFT_1081662 [Mycena capillaripes]